MEIAGPDAAGFCAGVFAGHVGRPPGAVVYTQALNERGGIEMDVTVSRLDADAFFLVTGTAFGLHDLGWLRRQARLTGADVRIADVTSAWACFGLWGPQARGLLAPLTQASLANVDFPYPSMQETTVADVPVRALRVTYVGELGWELYCPMEYGAALWEALAATGATPGGYRAIESLRLEKGYRAWGSDIGPVTTPAEAGLGFAVRRGAGFVGAAALGEPVRRLRCLTLADPLVVALGGEPVWIGDTVVGQVTSGGYGYTVARSIAYAYLPVTASGPAAVAVDGDRVAAEVATGALYDPKGTRIRL
jgi:4-methylaminobutanoate oxidase (formaldehyde-forming)